jgi:hypothetical protein
MVYFFISIPLIPYSYGVEVFHFPLDLYTIGRTPWTSDRPVARPLPKYRTTQTQNKRAHTHTPNIHARSGTRTHDHGVRASGDSSSLRSLGYRDRAYGLIGDIRTFRHMTFRFLLLTPFERNINSFLQRSDLAHRRNQS